MIQDTDKQPIAQLTPEQIEGLAKSIGPDIARSPVVSQITINLHQDGQVSLSWANTNHIMFFGMMKEAELSFIGYQKQQAANEDK